MIINYNALKKHYLQLFLSIIFSLISMLSYANTTAIINDIRYWHSPEKVRVVFDISNNIKYKFFTLKTPDRLILDLQNTTTAPTLIMPTSINNSYIKKLRYGIKKNNEIRIVFDLNKLLKTEVFLLDPYGNYGYRLVVDFLLPKSQQKNESTPPTILKNRKIIIAIDPGHGGEDPGAIGFGGGYEKHIVFNISKELKTLIDKQKGFKAIMTRTGDYYVPLRKRTQIARNAGADLFVSIHADSFHNRHAHGVSVFTLSQKGATSETARWLAESENSSDKIGGDDGIYLGDKNESLVQVLLDLSMTSTLSSSIEVGKQVLKSVGKISRLHGNYVEKAGFMVLKSPDMPSILVETGFMSNPKESRKLRNKKYQRSMAKHLSVAILTFFHNKPPVNTLIANLKSTQYSKNITQKKYTIKNGDTLSEIASQFRVNLNSLKKINQIKSMRYIRSGQTLIIPN